MKPFNSRNRWIYDDPGLSEVNYHKLALLCQQFFRAGLRRIDENGRLTAEIKEYEAERLPLFLFYCCWSVNPVVESSCDRCLLYVINRSLYWDCFSFHVVNKLVRWTSRVLCCFFYCYDVRHDDELKAWCGSWRRIKLHFLHLKVFIYKSMLSQLEYFFI